MKIEAAVLVVVGLFSPLAWADAVTERLHEYSMQAFSLHSKGIELTQETKDGSLQAVLGLCSMRLLDVASRAQTYSKLWKMAELVTEPENVKSSRKILNDEAREWTMPEGAGKACLSASTKVQVLQHAAWLEAVWRFLMENPMKRD